MLNVINIAILLASIKILNQTQKPLHPAIIYAIVRLIFGILLTGALMASLIGSLISFVLAFIYFWLLVKTDGSIFWWIVLILGLAIGLV